MYRPTDICFCTNKECKLRDKCLRNPDHYDMRGTIESYADLYDGEECSYFWRLEGGEVKKKWEDLMI